MSEQPTVLDERLYYRKVLYKYELDADFMGQTLLRPDKPIDHEYIYLTTNGVIILKKGYAWDGCSGPTHDDGSNMIAGAKHDAGYQLIRLGLLDISCKRLVDEQIEIDIKRDSERVKHPWYLRWWRRVDRFRAEYYHKAVEWFGYESARPQVDEVYSAP